jgi:hypothetical protein
MLVSLFLLALLLAGDSLFSNYMFFALPRERSSSSRCSLQISRVSGSHPLYTAATRARRYAELNKHLLVAKPQQPHFSRSTRVTQRFFFNLLFFLHLDSLLLHVGDCEQVRLTGLHSHTLPSCLFFVPSRAVSVFLTHTCAYFIPFYSRFFFPLLF